MSDGERKQRRQNRNANKNLALNPWLNVREAAAHCGLAEGTVYNLGEAKAHLSEVLRESRRARRSSWPDAIGKHSIGRLSLPDAPERYVPSRRERHGFVSLPLPEEAVSQTLWA